MKNSKRQKSLESLVAVTHTHTILLAKKMEITNTVAKSVYFVMLLLVQICAFGNNFYGTERLKPIIRETMLV